MRCGSGASRRVDSDCLVPGHTRLHDAVVAPGPAGAQPKLLYAAGRCRGIVQGLGREDYAELAEQFLEDLIPVSQPGKFDSIAVDIQYHGLFARNDQFFERPQIEFLAAQKLNELAAVVDRSRVDNHSLSRSLVKTGRALQPAPPLPAIEKSSAPAVVQSSRIATEWLSADFFSASFSFSHAAHPAS